jgi:hypothetical protein
VVFGISPSLRLGTGVQPLLVGIGYWRLETVMELGEAALTLLVPIACYLLPISFSNVDMQPL